MYICESMHEHMCMFMNEFVNMHVCMGTHMCMNSHMCVCVCVILYCVHGGRAELPCSERKESGEMEQRAVLGILQKAEIQASWGQSLCFCSLLL